MAALQEPVSLEDIEKNKPVLEDMAVSIMAHMAEMSVSEISEILGISSQLAIKAHNLAYEFPHKFTGYNALKAFIGDAYRGLDVASMSKDSLKWVDEDLRIISSVYGILKPSDIIKPYRCEFNKQIAPGHKTPIQVFKSKITVNLVNYIKENKITDIIDLLPGDADKCVDWKIVRAFTKVHKILIQEEGPAGKLKTPIAKTLKESRGRMCREILENKIQTFSDLCSFDSSHFIYSPEYSKPGLPVFLIA